MRAGYPDIEGFVERDGVKIGYEVFGNDHTAPAELGQAIAAELGRPVSYRPVSPMARRARLRCSPSSSDHRLR